MNIEIRNVERIIPDNESQYYSMLEGLISGVDNNCSLMINKGIGEIYFRISPSLPKYSQMILEELLKFHNLMKLEMNLSKSIRLTSNISYSLHLK